MDITNEAYEALDRYFSLLKHTGYKPYGEVEKLFIFLFIEEILTGPMSDFITKEDYDDINAALGCLYGTCLLPFPTYRRGIDEIRKNVFEQYRISEDSNIRHTENSDIRVKS